MPTNAEVEAAMSPRLLAQARDLNPHNRHLHIEGGTPFIPADSDFDPKFPHSFCYLCGAVYQSELDRLPTPKFKDRYNAESKRSIWRHKHSDSHSMAEHIAYRASGRQFTPIAAHRLSQIGIIPISDTVFDDEVRHATETAPRFNQNVNDEMEKEDRAVL